MLDMIVVVVYQVQSCVSISSSAGLLQYPACHTANPGPGLMDPCMCVQAGGGEREGAVRGWGQLSPGSGSASQHNT